MAAGTRTHAVIVPSILMYACACAHSLVSTRERDPSQRPYSAVAWSWWLRVVTVAGSCHVWPLAGRWRQSWPCRRRAERG